MNCIVMIYKLLISLAALGINQIKTSFIWYSALVCLTLTAPKLGGGSEKLQTSLLFRSPCTNF